MRQTTHARAYVAVEVIVVGVVVVVVVVVVMGSHLHILPLVQGPRPATRCSPDDP